jgi:hypothetical protein
MTGRLVHLCLGVGLVTTLNGGPLEAQEDFSWSEGMTAGQVLEVKGITGSIRAELAEGGAAFVSARKRGRQSDLERVEIRVVEEGDGYTICAVYDPTERTRECGHRDDDDDDDRRDHRRDRSIDVDVDFVVSLPRGVELIGTTVTGDVEVEEVDSDVTASSVTGDVVVSTRRTAWASTVSGSIDVEMGQIDRSQRFHTVSGDITLRLPPDLDADIRFSSLSGELDTDFDLYVERESEKLIGSDVRGTIGEGGPRLSFNTVSGDVTLRRATATPR